MSRTVRCVCFWVVVNMTIMLARIGRYGSDYDIANPLIVDNDICLVCGYPLLF